MEEDVSDKKMTIMKNDEEKEAECLDDISPIDMEECVKDRNDDINKNMMRKKSQNSQMTLLLLIWRKV